MTKIKVGSIVPVSKSYNKNSYAVDEKGNRIWQGIERSIIIEGRIPYSKRAGGGLQLAKDFVVFTELDSEDWEFITTEYANCPHIKNKQIVTGKNEAEITATLKANQIKDTSEVLDGKFDNAKIITNPML